MALIITIQPTDDIQNYLDLLDTYGGGILNLNPTVVFNVTETINWYSNITLNGNGATIDFNGTASQILIQGSDPYSTGTVSVNYASSTVTGVGTTWTVGMIGQSILIGDYFYEIIGVSSTTSLSISPAFRAPNITGAEYRIATTLDSTAVTNVVLTNSSISALKFKYINTLTMDGLTILNSAQGIEGSDSQGPVWNNSEVVGCIIGITNVKCPFGVINSCNVLDISGGTGIDLNGSSNMAISALSIQAVTGVGMKFTNCPNIGLINYAYIECSSHGIEFVSGNKDINVSEGYIDSCGGDGIKLTASTNTCQIFGNSIINCTGWGINIANANDNNNIVSSNSFTNNTAGNLQNLGTNTIANGNQGVTNIPNSSGTVTTVSVATANGFSGTVANATTTPAITIIAGAITPTTVNGNTFTTGSSTYTGTAGQTYTFPTTSATLARTDAANTFTGVQTMTSPVLNTKPTINNFDNTGATYAPSSGSQTVALDCASNNMHIVSGNVNGTAITFTIANATNNQPFIVSILQGSGTVSTIAGWFATVRWVGGITPTLTATLNKRDTFGFIRTGSATYDGFIIGQNC